MHVAHSKHSFESEMPKTSCKASALFQCSSIIWSSHSALACSTFFGFIWRCFVWLGTKVELILHPHVYAKHCGQKSYGDIRTNYNYCVVCGCACIRHDKKYWALPFPDSAVGDTGDRCRKTGLHRSPAGTAPN